MWITWDFPFLFKDLVFEITEGRYYPRPSRHPDYLNMKKESVESELIQELVK